MLDDEETRKNTAWWSFTRLGQLWNDQARPAEIALPGRAASVFLRLMERFDLSYRVADPSQPEERRSTRIEPDRATGSRLSARATVPTSASGCRERPSCPRRSQQVQICRIVDARTGNRPTAEGLFYQLIVRLHKYSLGRADYNESVHWQRGLVLDDDYNGRALLEHIGNDVRITVRAPYPEASWPC